MITRVSTKDMSREEWLARRRKSIGGSDAGAVLGLNPYVSAYSLFCEKTGLILPEDIGDKEAVRIGNDLEQYVADRFTEKTGKKVRRDHSMIYNENYPFAHADIDRRIVGENAGLECKTTSSFEILSRLEEGKYPEQWYCQMVHYMMVTGAERWYLGCLVLGKGFFEFTIERNEEEIQALASAEKEFWEMVVKKEAPGFDGSEATKQALKIIFAESNPGLSVDLTAVSGHLTAYCHCKARMKELEEELNQQQAYIIEFMADAEKGSCASKNYGNISVSFKTQSRRNFDLKAYEADHGPIAEKYFKVVTSRPFKVTVKKEKGE